MSRLYVIVSEVPSLDEHARYNELLSLLQSQQEITPAFATDFVRRVLADEDAVMAQSAAVSLINHDAMTAAVLDEIQPLLPPTWAAATEHLVERRLRLPMEHGPIHERHAIAAVASGGRRLQLWLVDQPEVPAPALQLLADAGVTRAIRNRAAARLRR